MAATIVREPEPKSSTTHDMRDGDVAVITGSHYKDTLVVRRGDDLFRLNKESGHGWTGFCRPGNQYPFQVRILKPGTVIRL